MTKADPEAVRSYYDYVDAEEYEEVFSLFADDVTYDRPGQSHLDGMAEFREFYLEDRPLEDGDHEVHQLVAEGDTVAVRGRFAGTQDGEEVAFDFADFHRFDDDGKITSRWTYTDRDEV
ncbi:nuclear transport factor 2 family protein [Halorussus limi]|uniref:Nuclear transport factor 2 family protein n=1 Tax=Halorussus limi TaxID=2938695 RepID=A0A8U0HQ70_9EURY|nr:nuclear transport factor 2 family protein [Halorussus limi]UPV73100.1 nuclear transport factor 2 family protein [Halorussus limi]